MRPSTAGSSFCPQRDARSAACPNSLCTWQGVRYALTSNGATVTELATGRRLVELTFDAEEAMRIYDVLSPFECAMSIFIDGKTYTSTENLEKLEKFCPRPCCPI